MNTHDPPPYSSKNNLAIDFENGDQRFTVLPGVIGPVINYSDGPPPIYCDNDQELPNSLNSQSEEDREKHSILNRIFKYIIGFIVVAFIAVVCYFCYTFFKKDTQIDLKSTSTFTPKSAITSAKTITPTTLPTQIKR